MFRNKRQKKAWMSSSLLILFVFILFGSGLFVPIHSLFATVGPRSNGSTVAGTTSKAWTYTELAAEGVSTVVPGAYSNPQAGVADALETASDSIFTPAMQVAVVNAGLDLITYVLDRLAYAGAMAIASAGEGQSALIFKEAAWDSWQEFGLDVAGEAIGSLSELMDSALDIQFNLCAPSDPLLKMAFQLSLRQAYIPQEPKCDFRDIQKNWGSFISSAVSTITDDEKRNETVMKAFTDGLRPGKNELSASIMLNVKIHEEVLQKKTTEFEEMLASDGYKDKVNFITGTIETPSSLLQRNFEDAVQDKKEKSIDYSMNALIFNKEIGIDLLFHVASIFTNTLLSTLMNRIYTGLFLEVDSSDFDPFDIETLASHSGKEAAEARFSDLVSTTPISVSDYNVLSEFLICPSGNLLGRNVNNCVMDGNFSAAIMRSTTDSALTVQEAIDQGLLNGNWPLISSEDFARNQDPYCYTYGYCYGNLVKMRKARVISVGWEMAALRNSVSNPATLQEIIDGFDDCTDDGEIDADTHKWCHLIDPNWVLKYPESQCRAMVNGEILSSSMSGVRQSNCADTLSCISENDDGQCDGGFGYCVREKNVWRFRGDECPEEYATCLSFENTYSGENASYLLNTVDYGDCTASDAGCRWYRTNKYYDDGGTVDDTSDDSYEWLATGDDYVVEDRDAFIQYSSALSGFGGRSDYAVSYTSDSGASYSYQSYTYEDRQYFTHEVTECAEQYAGCTELYEIEDDLVLNIVQNPSFEDDEDDDGVPDSWSISGPSSDFEYEEDIGIYFYGSDAIKLSDPSTSLVQKGLRLAPNSFYTWSFYAKSVSRIMDISSSMSFLNEEGNIVDLSGTSYLGDCVRRGGNTYLISETIGDTAWDRFSCTFTTMDEPLEASITLNVDANVYLDAIQLEVGEEASMFTTEYNDSSLLSHYLLVAPDYLGCSGDASDPAECDNYTQVCSSTEVGCRLYTPVDGDPSVPATISSIDECPSECSGYTTYKQEATAYDSEEFPLYFIADRATSCSAQYVGCDGFTNLDSIAQGGEGSEYYSYLRPCLTDGMADGSSTKTSSTFFTWEGSDTEGYQLMTWQLLESNANSSASITYEQDEDDDGTYDVSSDDYAVYAPCTQWQVTSEDTIVCNDSSAHLGELEIDDTCNEHNDIFDNPDCREFYDTQGNVHYRLWSETISVDNECHPYRKNVSEEQDCEDSGGYWASAGVCRYFGLINESLECPASSDGCREYTGGAGRNATTVFSDTFEDGDVVGYLVSNASITLSNESVATDGHSLGATMTGASSSGIVETTQAYLDSTNTSVVFDGDDTAVTCTALGHTLADDECQIDADSDGAIDCTIEEGDNSCGTLDDQLVVGKTYVLSFWAKGSGNMTVAFVEEGGTGDEHDFVSPTTSVLESISLSGSWQLYELGPLDTTSFDAFDDTAIIEWSSPAGELFFLDNIQLKQVEENITIIKDSWVVPSTCDATSEGTLSDQYYLGCEEYADDLGETVYLYQFTRLCSEDAVGCKAFYDTQNTDTALANVYNARCLAHATDDPTTPSAVGGVTTCEVDGMEYCTILTGQTYCLFDLEQALPVELPSDSNFSVVLGPEVVVVPNDLPVYLIDNEGTTCSADLKGCQEFGNPTFSQDHSEVTEFESVYFINLPDQYEDILCDHDALFCEEWTSTQDGNFYFKDPEDQTCSYETGVTLNNVKYFGWFRKDTDEPCYWTDVNGNGTFEAGTDTSDYVISGEEMGIWRNGDTAFDGWVGACSQAYDLCSEFIDPTDIAAGIYEDGMSYYYVNNDLLSEDTLLDSQRCEGRVSQKEGCVLFNNTTESELNYNASASYIASVHADLLFGDEANSFEDPINCDLSGGGLITTPEGEVVDLCNQRCLYNFNQGTTDYILSPMAEDASYYPHYGFTQYKAFFERSCYQDSDCPAIETSQGELLSGTCEEAVYQGTITFPSPTYPLINDTNTILKVNRDRECAAWLSCSSSMTSWSDQNGLYQTICDEVSLCSEFSTTGDSTICTNYLDTNPDVLTAALYASRDVSWQGWEYSGYAIPQQLPIEHYEQNNIAFGKYCLDSEGITILIDDDGIDSPVSCESTDDCLDLWTTEDALVNGSCVSVDADYRLSYSAGSCDTETVGEGGTCYVGFCENSGEACVDSDGCATGEDCVVGYCQVISAVDCTKDADCSGTTLVCDPFQGVCVDQLTPNTNTCVTQADCASSATCTLSSNAFIGSCYNDACLTDIRDTDDNGQPDPLEVEDARASECRGYPEAESPFPATKLVQYWQYYLGSGFDTATEVQGAGDQPYTLAYGFQNVKTCAPVEEEGVYSSTDECLCNYQKAEYGDGAGFRYYPIDYTGDMLEGVCVGGAFAGRACETDSECSSDGSYSGGTCMIQTRLDSVYGWNGYCLEKDTSIQLYNSPAEEDQACLTWLPVDQLEGSTDLYGKYTEAGYDGGETYFCAETDGYYDIGVSSMACAEFVGAGCNTFSSGLDWNEFTEAMVTDHSSEHQCIGNVYCPEGFFAVMTGCRDYGYTPSDIAAPTEEDEYCDKDYGGGEDSDTDCAFFCVPENSYTEEADYCDPPGEGIGTPSEWDEAGKDVYTPPDDYESYYVAGVYRSVFPDPDLERPEFDLYMIHPDYFEEAYAYYEGCTAKGISYDVVRSDYITPWAGFSEMVDDLPNPADLGEYGYYNLQFNFNSYGACEVLQSVSGSEPGDNTAWTDRVWQYANYLIDTTEANLQLAYSAIPGFFGKSAEYSVFNEDDAYPMEMLMCKDTGTSDLGTFSAEIPSADGSCVSATASLSDDYYGRAYQDFYLDEYGQPGTHSSGSTSEEKIQQLFAKAIGGRYAFSSSEGAESLGAYSIFDRSTTFYWDITATGDANKAPSAPIVRSVENCQGSRCEEGEDGTFSVNDQSSGDISTGNGQLHASVRFFVEADADQMPIKNIIVDWGDEDDALGASDWPSSSRSGSTSSDNFYKNHRGLSSFTDGLEYCTSNASQADDWGEYTSACDTSYLNFTNDYVCNTSILSNLEALGRTCLRDADGKLNMSPCIEDGACVFQPRVLVKDNWGWCTGECDGEYGCYDGYDSTGVNECDWDECPGGRCQSPTADPWIYYDGTISIEP